MYQIFAGHFQPPTQTEHASFSKVSLNWELFPDLLFFFLIRNNKSFKETSQSEISSIYSKMEYFAFYLSRMAFL